MPREPIDLIIAKGNKPGYTKSEIAQRKNEEVRTKKDNIVAPDYLNKDEVDKFNFYVEEMLYSNIISDLDVALLARHVHSELKFENIAKQLNDLEPIEASYHELFKTYDKLYKNLITSSNALGFNAMARCKIQIKNQAPEIRQNKFNKFMG